MKKAIALAACAAISCLGVIEQAQAQASSGRLVVSFQGPGGHSFSNYGRTSAVHAAARAIVALQSAGMPVNSYVVQNYRGGNSVNSIAGDAVFDVVLNAASAGAYEELVTKVTTAAQSGANAENAFRGVKDGDTTSGVPANIRVAIQRQ